MDSTTRTQADVQAELDALRAEGKDRRTKEVRDLEAELERMDEMGDGPPKASAGHFSPDLSVAGGGKATKYWIGTLPGAPVQNAVVGGTVFPLFTGKSMVIEDKNRKRRVARGEVDKSDRRPHTFLPGGYMKGKVVDLRADQVAAIKKNLARKAIAWRDHDKTNGYVFNVDSPKVKLFGGEEPLARYVFMVKTPHRSDEWPAPIEALGIEDPDN